MTSEQRQQRLKELAEELASLLEPEDRYCFHYKQISALCKEQEWGDAFSYARSKEIYATFKLGHRISPTLSGADAINKRGEPVEYKSTTDSKVKGAYTGISCHDTWEEQEEYLIKEKIGKYPEHYYNRFDVDGLAESWVVPGSKVLEILTPKLKRSYPHAHKKKDPRLSANITNTEIKKYGRQVI